MPFHDATAATLLLLALCTNYAEPKDVLRSGRHHRDGSTTLNTAPSYSYDDETLHGNNVCLDVACPRGRRCVPIDQKPICICLDRCPTRYRPVCGTDGMIYPNHCHLHRRACIDARRIRTQPMLECLQPSKRRSNGAKKEARSTEYHKSTHALHLSQHPRSQQPNTRNTARQEISTDKQHEKPAHDGANSNAKNAAGGPITTGQPYEPKPPSIDVNGGEEPTTRSDVIKTEHDVIKTVVSDVTTEGEHGGEEREFRPAHICSLQAFQAMKDSLLELTRTRLQSNETVATRYSHHHRSRDFVISRIFSQLDANQNGLLELSELEKASTETDWDHLQPGCDLTDLLHFDDLGGDHTLDMSEFFAAFNKQYSIQMVSLDKSLQFNRLTALEGDNVEIKCDISGSPKPQIIWKRSGRDLSRLGDDTLRVFPDGSLYITHVRPVHAGNYSCQAKDDAEVEQTHMLVIEVPPFAEVDLSLQTRGVGQLAKIHCYAEGNPTPKISWLKNESPVSRRPGRYDVIGDDGSSLLIGPLTTSDTGAYMCEARSAAGRARAVSSLLVQTDMVEESGSPQPELLVHHDWGITIYDPTNCRLEHEIQGSDPVPGHQDYVCGDLETVCEWGDARPVGADLVYLSQPRLQRVIVVSRKRKEVVDVVTTDELPVKLEYVPQLDQVWVLNWRTLHNRGARTVQVIRNASQSRKHHTVHLQPLNHHVDLVVDMFVPPPELPHQHYAYVTHINHRGMFKVDMQTLNVVKSVDLMPYNCVPQVAQFANTYGYLILSCAEPVTSRHSGQVLFDQLTDNVVSYLPELRGRPHLTPDSRDLVTLSREEGFTTVTVHRVNEHGLQFAFDVRTPLNISDVTFHARQSARGADAGDQSARSADDTAGQSGFDLWMSGVGVAELMRVDLNTGRVEILTGIGHGLPISAPHYGVAQRPLLSSGRHHSHLAAVDGSSVVIVDAARRQESCHVAGLRGIGAPLWLPLL